MSTVNVIKEQIKSLFEAAPDIHVSVKMSHPKISVDDTPARIVGVYPNIFRIEEQDDGYPRYHSVKYTEVLTGQVKIREIED